MIKMYNNNLDNKIGKTMVYSRLWTYFGRQDKTRHRYAFIHESN